jgi:hypothetical protein
MYVECFENCGPGFCECTALSLKWRDMKSTEIVDQDIG